MTQKVYVKPQKTIFVAQLVILPLFMIFGFMLFSLADGEVKPFVAIFILIWEAGCIAILLNAVKALKDVDATVKGMVAIFNYGFEIAEDNFKKANIELTTLSNYESLLEQAMDSHYINEKYRTTLSDWRKNPSEWNYTKIESKN